MRGFVSLLWVLLLLVACNPEPTLDLEQLEKRARSGELAAIQKCVDLLAHDDQKIADRSYTLLVELGDQSVSALLAKVNSENSQQREYVIAALGTNRVGKAVPQISAVLQNSVYQRRYVAAWALGEIGDPTGVQPLLTALEDDNPEVRRYATRALIKLNKLAVPALIDYLSSVDGEGAAGAIRALGDIADPRALDVLLLEIDGSERGEAFLALGKLRDRRAVSALIDGLGDPDWQVRMNAAMALGPLGDEGAVVPLQKLLDDQVHVVREWSARSLEMITGQPVLYRNSKDEMVRPYNVYH